MAKNRKFRGVPITRDLAVPSGVVSGDPVVDGQIPGVALIDRKADGRATVQLDGTFLLSVKGVITGPANSAVAEGDLLYYNAGHTPKLDKDTAGVRFGYAEGTVNSGATATIAVKVGY
jgi:predicted RecA/RadA family phage recombinase